MLKESICVNYFVRRSADLVLCVSVERDGDLKSWINRERFQNYMKIDSYTLYAMGETGNMNSPVHRLI